MNFHKKQDQGFTLIEILTAIIIVVVLVAMAAPLYEKTIERSHMGEARSLLMSMQDAKLWAMTKMNIDTFDTSTCLPQLPHLNVVYDEGNNGVSFTSKYFTYSLVPSGTGTNSNGVCAVRRGGDAAGTIFYFYRPFGKKGESGDSFLLCNDSDSGYANACEEIYGMPSTDGLACSTSCGS